ncbi:RrF2 family transcriptional regulator [Secundilactobacillus hailunensis]|uniref:RrF2 family transcriptional regulator n=1 Tax=Secundilactobacillus hailunensis TaxID=2559923 RepID=A0ABW1T8T8_9LACO|nr:Rrf2 family transcriptional regulator [Secundilactobacillus hailunensis]
MKFKIGVEQAIYVVVILARQQDQQPLKSKLLSQILQVSDSYLHKITRQLAVQHIITTDASKTGGLTLARPTSEISLLDIFEAIEGTDSFASWNNLRDQVLRLDNHAFKQKFDQVSLQFKQAEESYKATLAKFSIADLLSDETDSFVDWNNISETR